MNYEHHNWQEAELITAAKLNNIEDGIVESIQSSDAADKKATDNEDRIDLLYDFSKGQIYDVQNLTFTANSMPTPESAYALAPTEINCQTIVINQLVPDGGGQVQLSQYRKYLVSASNTEYIIENSGASQDLEDGDSVYDLTLMFSKSLADEITVENAHIRGVPSAHIAQNDGEIVNGKVTSIVCYDSNNNEIGRFDIPQAALDRCTGYGWSTGKLRNRIEYLPNEKKWRYIQDVGVVDMGTLNWKKGDNFFFCSEFSTSLSWALTCAKYAWGGNHGDNDAESKRDGWLTRYNNGSGIRICDTKKSDLTKDEFKTSMSGQILYYQLPSTSITDITSEMPPYELLNCEPGGTIKFVQESGKTVGIYNKANYYIKTNSSLAGIPKGVQVAGTDLPLDANGKVNIPVATQNDINGKTNTYKPVTPSGLNSAVRAGLLSNNLITSADYDSILATIGIVRCTQEEYDLMDSHNPNVTYIIRQESTT